MKNRMDLELRCGIHETGIITSVYSQIDWLLEKEENNKIYILGDALYQDYPQKNKVFQYDKTGISSPDMDHFGKVWLFSDYWTIRKYEYSLDEIMIMCKKSGVHFCLHNQSFEEILRKEPAARGIMNLFTTFCFHNMGTESEKVQEILRMTDIQSQYLNYNELGTGLLFGYDQAVPIQYPPFCQK